MCNDLRAGKLIIPGSCFCQSDSKVYNYMGLHEISRMVLKLYFYYVNNVGDTIRLSNNVLDIRVQLQNDV